MKTYNGMLANGTPMTAVPVTGNMTF